MTSHPTSHHFAVHAIAGVNGRDSPMPSTGLVTEQFRSSCRVKEGKHVFDALSFSLSSSGH